MMCFYLCDFITAINLRINNLYDGLRCNKVSDFCTRTFLQHEGSEAHLRALFDLKK